MTGEDYREWKRDPRTEAWFKALEEEERADADTCAVVDIGSVDKTAMLAAKQAGIVEGIDRCLNFAPEGVEP